MRARKESLPVEFQILFLYSRAMGQLLIPVVFFLASTADVASAEVRRLQRHFDSVVTELEAAFPPGLTFEQTARRHLNIERLRRYGLRGEFPEGVRGKFAPRFVDQHGTRCAVGELLWLTDEREIVSKIALADVHILVEELVDEAEFSDWLRREGLSLEEAARIQPSYRSPEVTCLCPAESPPAVLEATVRRDGPEPVVMLTKIYGDDQTVPWSIGDEIVNDAFTVPISFSVWENAENTFPRTVVGWIVETDDFGVEVLWHPVVDGSRVQCPTCTYGAASCVARAPPLPVAVEAMLADDCAVRLESWEATGCAATSAGSMLPLGLLALGLLRTRRAWRPRNS